MPEGRVLAPGPRRGAGPGAFVWLLGTLLLSASCEAPPALRPAPELELEDRTVTLAPSASILEVRVRAAGATDQIEPDSIASRPGDVVRFVAGDALTHAIGFDDAALDAQQRGFLLATQQQRSPPLLSVGSTWVVSLEDAPPGRYPFVCLTHGGRGTVHIVAPD